LSEFRFSRAVIRGAIEAEREDYDVFFMNHFQDVGLYEARAAVKIPVLGLGEATLLHACTMGRKLGLLAINPAFIPTHNEQIVRYGLQQRIAGCRAIEANISDYMDAFASPAKKSEMQSLFERDASRAPSRRLLNLAQTTSSATRPQPAEVSKPQSVPACTRDGSPTTWATRSMRSATTSGCSTKFVRLSMTPATRT